MKRLLLSLVVVLLWTMNLSAQIPPGYYNGTEGIYGSQLKAVLHGIIDEHDEPTYNDLA